MYVLCGVICDRGEEGGKRRSYSTYMNNTPTHYSLLPFPPPPTDSLFPTIYLVVSFIDFLTGDDDLCEGMNVQCSDVKAIVLVPMMVEMVRTKSTKRTKRTKNPGRSSPPPFRFRPRANHARPPRRAPCATSLYGCMGPDTSFTHLGLSY